MNKLNIEERAKILHLLCEGMSIRAITRLAGVSKNTVAKLLIDAGKACAAYHDANVRNVKAGRVQVDEIWSFNNANQKNVADAKAAFYHAGDTWTWTAIDADSKMIVSYLVGGRNAEHAIWFMDDLSSRLASSVQQNSYGHPAYLEQVERAVGADLNYGQLVRLYGNSISPPGRYSAVQYAGSKKIRREGDHDIDNVSTKYVERQNVTMRMHMRRFTGLTKAFSKKIENHAHAVALQMMFYNFVRIQKTLRVTPAMAAGVAERRWEIADIAKLVEDAEAVPEKRGSYRKQAE